MFYYWWEKVLIIFIIFEDYDELVASHAAVGETPDQEDDPIEGEALR